MSIVRTKVIPDVECICYRPHGADGRFVAKYKTEDERRIANNKASRKYRALHREKYLEISRRCKRHRDLETRRTSHNRASANERRKKRAVVSAAKSTPCTDCGVSYPPYVMDFDHVRGGKLFTIGEKCIGKRVPVILEEIKKCEVVCANCHRIREYRRRCGTSKVGGSV